MHLRRRLGEQNGFTLAEIIVALLILSIALVPMTGMFDTAVKGLLNSERIKNSAECATTALEQISGMPFYQAYDADKGDVDIDDHFWGDRNPLYLSPIAGGGTPDWAAIPEVLAKDYNTTPVFNELSSLGQYKDCKVSVALAYLNDNTGAVSMNHNWGPKLDGKDKPLTADNENPHLILIHINVYYKVNGSERNYILEQIVTDTQAIYGVGINQITAEAPPVNLPLPDGQGPVFQKTAIHWPNNNVTVKIAGWGFDATGTPPTPPVAAYLVRNKYNDIPINLSSRSDTLLVGTVDLYDTGTSGVSGETDCYPRAGVGYWSVRIQQQGIINAYLFNGFIVAFPKPVISDFYNGTVPGGAKTATNIQTAQQITIQGGPFPYKKNAGTLIWCPNVSLVPVGGTSSDMIIGTVTAMSGGNNDGYAASTGCTITATFDLTQAQPGQYKMQVWNTDAAAVGNVASDLNLSPIYTITSVPPIVTDVYVSGTNPHQTNVYENIGNVTVRLEIIGNYFNTINGPPYVRVYLYPSVAGVGQPPGATTIEGSVVAVTATDITADFTLASLALGNYNVYVVNQDTGLSGYITAAAPRINVTNYSGSITGFTPNLGGFYENYFDYTDGSVRYRVTGTITGTGLLDITNVTIKDLTTGTEYDDMNYTINSDTTITLYLNLIDCDNTHNWEVRAYRNSYVMSRPFDVTLGAAMIIPYNTFGDSRAAIYIDRGSSVNPRYGYETGPANGTLVARAKRSGTAIFYVRGMGFPINDQTTLRIYGWSGNPNQYQGNYSCTRDRAGKIVGIVSATWNVPGTNGYYNISVQANGFAATAYTQRWRVTTSGN